MKTLGILGGMGPLAGAYFYMRIIENTPATRDGEHIPVLLCGIPQIPDRTEHLLGLGASPLGAMTDGIARLEAAGAEVIAIPCNTAHAFMAELRDRSTLPILDMPWECVSRACEDGARRLGILSTRGTRLSGVFDAAAHGVGAEVLYPSEESGIAVEMLIYRQKRGEALTPQEYRPFICELYERGADAIVLGCTEISVAFAGRRSAGIYDALESLAQAAVQVCIGKNGAGEKDAVFEAIAR